MNLDSFDRRLLHALQEDAHQTAQALSERVHLSPSQCNRRQRRLEEAGLIERYVALLNPELAGLHVMAVVNVRLDRHDRASAALFREAVGTMERVLECWSVTGDSDYVLKVVARDLKDLNTLVMDGLLALGPVASVRSSILLDQLKSTTRLPV